jgi:hypothetical protein
MPRAFDEQQRQHVFLRKIRNPENAAIDQLDIENHVSPFLASAFRSTPHRIRFRSTGWR